jgi:outer membrane protein assembly factor BamB
MSVEFSNNKLSSLCTLSIFTAMALTAGCVGAAEIAGWRTDGNGKYTTATPPTEWAPTKNVVWSTPMPSWGNACPVLLGGMLYFTAEPETLVCVDASNGKIAWQKTNTLEDAATPEMAAKAEAAKKEGEPIQKEMQKLQSEQQPLRKQARGGDAEAKKKLDENQAKMADLKKKLEDLGVVFPPKTHDVNGYSSATPVTDGKNVYAVFGNGVACCYDVKGNRVWIRHIEPPSNQQNWGHSSSPVLSGDKLFVHLTDLRALNTATGAEIWSAKLPAYWGTSTEIKLGEVPTLLTPSGALVRISDGHVMAQNIAHLTYCSPIVQDGIAYFFDEPQRTAVKLPTAAADSVKAEVLWNVKAKMDRYYASPILNDGLLYAVHQKGKFSVIDAKTGEAVYEKELALGGTAYPSVTMAGKYVYVSSDNGVTVVVEAGREFKEVARNTLEPFRGSPVFDGKRLYVRGQAKLYCIGE